MGLRPRCPITSSAPLVFDTVAMALYELVANPVLVCLSVAEWWGRARTRHTATGSQPPREARACVPRLSPDASNRDGGDRADFAVLDPAGADQGVYHEQLLHARTDAAPGATLASGRRAAYVTLIQMATKIAQALAGCARITATAAD